MMDNNIEAVPPRNLLRMSNISFCRSFAGGFGWGLLPDSTLCVDLEFYASCVNQDIGTARLFQYPSAYDDGNVASRRLLDTMVDMAEEHRETLPVNIRQTYQAECVQPMVAARNMNFAREDALVQAYIDLGTLLSTATKPTMNRVRNIFHMYRDVAWYNRRWRGPGKPLPYASATTDDGYSGEHNITVSDSVPAQYRDIIDDKVLLYISFLLNKITLEFAKLPANVSNAVRDLKTLNKRTAVGDPDARLRFVPRYHDLRQFHQRMITDQECVRMSSQPLLHTCEFAARHIYKIMPAWAKLTDPVDGIA
jgi:hypothetical protein